MILPPIMFKMITPDGRQVARYIRGDLILQFGPLPDDGGGSWMDVASPYPDAAGCEHIEVTYSPDQICKVIMDCHEWVATRELAGRVKVAQASQAAANQQVLTPEQIARMRANGQ